MCLGTADIVLAVERGLIIGAFVADKWLEATPAYRTVKALSLRFLVIWGLFVGTGSHTRRRRWGAR